MPNQKENVKRKRKGYTQVKRHIGSAYIHAYVNNGSLNN